MGKKHTWKVPKVEPVTPPTRVIVVGAGLAGLTVARALQDARVDVVVLEASDHIGGRSTTVQMQGVPVELGAAWVHGIKGSPTAEAFAALGQQLAYDDWLDVIAHDPHGRVPDALLKPALEWAEELVDDSEDLAESIGGDPPVIDGIERWLDSHGLTGRTRDVYDVLLRFGFEHDVGGPAEVGSLSHWDSGTLPKGGDYVPIGGYGPLVDALADGLDVQLNEPVNHIAWSTSGVEVTTRTHTLSASHVVVTVPLGVLKADAITFEPDVPTTHRTAWGRLQMGALEKVVLVFGAPLDAGGRDTVLHLDPQNPSALPVVNNVSRFAGGSVWVAFSSGGWSRVERPLLSDNALISLALQRLAKGLGIDVPAPIATRVTRWVDDPLALGSYSFLPVGSSPDDFDTCAIPVGGRVLFAGEHTDADWYQTTHGAIRSGLREARRLGVRPVWPPLSFAGVAEEAPAGETAT
ncbi:MAG: monoamine oxidase [Myxococcota bacterium]|jgi:monoamine oxidase